MNIHKIRISKDKTTNVKRTNKLEENNGKDSSNLSATGLEKEESLEKHWLVRKNISWDSAWTRIKSWKRKINSNHFVVSIENKILHRENILMQERISKLATREN